jgi:methionyl-tRNA formyltransferase
MRIIVNGMQAFGKAVLDRLIERGDEVVAVYCPEDNASGRMDPLKEGALCHELPIYQPKSFKTEAVADEFRAHKADLCVMAFVTKIIPSTILNIPAKGSIQYHPSLLPKHRGPSSINWPIIQGETKTGLTIFWPDDGLDTGPLLLWKEVEIEPNDTLGSVYFQKLFPLGVDAMIEAVDLVESGTAPRIEQDHELATYEGWCTGEDAAIDWNRPAQEIHNLIRGANPQPGAWTMLGDEVMQIFDSLHDAAVTGTPGEIVEIDGNDIVVAAANGGVRVQRLRCGLKEKESAADFVARMDLAVGQRLGGINA